jgi:thiol:disulfide interchange protein DsbC
MKTTKRMSALLLAGLTSLTVAAEFPRPENAAAPAADTLKLAALTSTLKQKYPQTTFSSVSETKLPGIYEVVMGRNLAYVEETGRYFLFGHLFDMYTQTDLTESRQPGRQERKKIDFDALPFSDAIVTVRGKGSRKMAIFSDPDCPYCKELENNLATIEDVTLYTFLFPLEELHPQAKARSVGVWCAADRAKAWEDLVRKGQEPAAALCAHPVERNVALGASLGITGTPTIILENGAFIPGALPAAQLERLLGPSDPVVRK